MSAESASVAVFGPHPLLSITVERRGSDGDDVHVHSGGQGVWVARMAGELGAHPILCSFWGGETGKLLRPFLEELSGEVRLVQTTVPSGVYVIDRRSGQRDMIAQHWSDPPSRHEADDLFSIACAAALESKVLVVCGTVPKDSLPLETYGNLVGNARANGTQVVVDLSPPNLTSALEGRPTVVKLDDWQLGEFAQDDMTNPEKLRDAARRVLEAGAETVLVTRGGDPALVLRGNDAFELRAPKFVGGSTEGCGDSMVGALAAALARGFPLEEALRWGAAAGATNFLRHGLGSGSRDIVADLYKRVELERL
jgi:1-phosphofructokinase